MLKTLQDEKYIRLNYHKSVETKNIHKIENLASRAQSERNGATPFDKSMCWELFLESLDNLQKTIFGWNISQKRELHVKTSI